jgi:aromatic ring-opening dioxygenase catalytic subunit (LigB family)
VLYTSHGAPPLVDDLPTRRPQRLLHLGERLRRVRDEGVLIVGSGSLPTVCRLSTLAHPTIEHFSPLFVALGASSLAKRSIELV